MSTTYIFIKTKYKNKKEAIQIRTKTIVLYIRNSGVETTHTYKD